MPDHFEDIHGLLQEGKKVVLARIIRGEGSTPREVGTRCLVLEDGALVGTIGGGLLEYQVLERAKALFQNGLSALIRFQLTGNQVAETEMLCGGTADVYLEPLFPENTATRELFGRLNDLVTEGRSGALLTLIREGLGARDERCRLLLAEDGAITGEIGSVSPAAFGIDEMPGLEEFRETGEPGLMTFEESRIQVFVEPVRPSDTLYLFGAGHISTFLADLAGMVGFRVVVIDDRDEFANRRRFPGANKIIVSPFIEAFDRIRIDASSYIAIITRGHIHDRDVLLEALKRNSAYTGMIGSRRKRDMIYRSLIEAGVSESMLEQVHSPIGLDIGAETPEEIAVSIIAELIRLRASRRGEP